MISIASEQDLRDLANALPRELGIPGVVLGVSRGDSPIWLAASGMADVEGRRAMATSTPLRIGSISKTFAATAVAKLSYEERLAIDDPVVTYIPELARIRTNGHPIESLSIRHFLTHRSGILSDPPTRRWCNSPFPGIDEVLERIDLVEVVRAPGEVEKYSNLAYALLGELVARVAAVPYEDFLRDSFFAPANLIDTTFEAPAHRAHGYGLREGDAWQRRLYQELGAERPGGGMWSTAGDLLEWAQVTCGKYDSILPSPLASLLLRPSGPGRALGWSAVRSGDRVIHNHNGGIEGYVSSLAFCEADRSAAVVLTNGHSTETRRICLEILGVEDSGAVPAVETPPPSAAADSPIGSYTEGPLDCSASIVGGNEHDLELVGLLFNDASGLPVKLLPSGTDLFTLSNGRYIGEVLEIRRCGTGAVTGMAIAGSEYVRTTGQNGVEIQ